MQNFVCMFHNLSTCAELNMNYIYIDVKIILDMRLPMSESVNVFFYENKIRTI